MSSPSHPATRQDVVLPEVRMHVYRPHEPVACRVSRSVVCTAGPAGKAASFTRHVEFDVSGTNLAGAVVPGQSVGVIVPGTDAKGRPHQVRLYSVASPTKGEDGQGQVISTTVKRTIDEHWESHKLFLGLASNHLCDLAEGDEVLLTGPNGKRFLLPADPTQHDYLFFATGTGIAPFRGFVKDLLEAAPESKAVLVMGAPYHTDLLYDDFFTHAAHVNPNFSYLTAVSREHQRDGHGPMYVQERLATHHDALGCMLDSPRTLIYICGVAGMEMGIYQQLTRTLRSDVLEQYLEMDGETRANVALWDRKMLNRQIKPTRRMFVEVYA